MNKLGEWEIRVGSVKGFELFGGGVKKRLVFKLYAGIVVIG